MAFAVLTEDWKLTAYRMVVASGERAESEEVGQWEGVAHVLVGDFASLGRDQLLVLFSESEWARERERESGGERGGIE